jgi:threonine aldolase
MAIDLRSDTVTRPSEAMRRAMAGADVGDDVFGDDPTAHELEERAAELLGKEASLFVPSGTMANQIALRLHCRAGDEVIIGEGAHCYTHESGAAAALLGVQLVVAGRGGLFGPDAIGDAAKPNAYWHPRTRLVAMENTHNFAGGRVFPQRDVIANAARARELGLAVHLDGARIWNASAATGLSPAELCAPVDTVSACFSKGLGAPVGSVIAGPRALLEEGRRYRRMLGGAMRQVGVLCAAALHALEHNLPRLAEDHEKARRLAERLAAAPGVELDAKSVETNIVIFRLKRSDAASFARRAAERGVLVGPAGRDRIRVVTHLDVSPEEVDAAAGLLAELA